MSSVGSTGSTSNYDWLNTQSAEQTDRMSDLTMTDFIKMMVAELENQDPMDPMSNTEMLSQINQMRSISSSEKLSASIEALTLGQSLATASTMIGKTVTGVDTLGNKVTGTVDKVTIEDGTAKLYVGSSIIKIDSVTSINNPDEKPAESEGESDTDPAEETESGE